MEKKLIDYEGFEAYSKGVQDKYAEKKDIPTSLSSLKEDSNHRTVQDSEKTKWDNVTNKVDKVDGKQLSSNDYTNEDKKKVEAIPDNPKYTDTIPDLSGYAKKEEMPEDIFTIDKNDIILTNRLFQNYYLNKKIESKVSWNDEFFPRGVYVFRFQNTNNAPEHNFDFVVLTSFNADMDIWGDDIKVHSDFIEQVAMSTATGRIYNRYINLRDNRNEQIEHGYPSDKSCHVLGIRGRWTNWKEITENFATKEDVKKLMSNIPTLKKEVVTSLPQTGKDDVIYLVKDDKGKDNNNYLEYLWLNGKYELIGSTQVDLSGYVTKEEASKNELTLRNDFIGLREYVQKQIDNTLNKEKDKAIDGNSGTPITDNNTYTTPQYVNYVVSILATSRIEEYGEYTVKELEKKLNKTDIQEFTQQELEEAFK